MNSTENLINNENESLSNLVQKEQIDTNKIDSSIEIKNNKQSQIIEVQDKTEVENTPTKKKRVYWIDFLRIFACYLVILTHACLRGTKAKFGTYEWKVLVSYNSMTASTCVPYFVMISGMLFLNPKKKITIKTIFSKYILRMFKAYVFWVFYYALVDTIADTYVQKKAFQYQDLLKKLMEYFFNSYGHLWYLNFAIGLYMATPIFKTIVPDRTVTWYLIFLFCFVEQFMPNITYLLVNYYEIKQFQYLRNLVNTLKFELAGANIVYFLLGYMLNTHEFSKKKYVYLCYLASAIGFVMSIYYRLKLAFRDGKDNYEMIKMTCFHSAVSAVGVLLFFKNTLNIWIERIMEKEKIRKFILTVSECTFGIYLMHSTILDLSFFVFNANTFNPLFWAPIFTLIVFLTCFIITYIIRKVPIVRNIT